MNLQGRFYLIIMAMFCSFHIAAQPKYIKTDVLPKYLLAENAKVNVNLSFGMYDKAITSEGAIYKLAVDLIKTDLTRLGIKAQKFNLLMVNPYLKKKGEESAEPTLPLTETEPNITMAFAIMNYPKKVKEGKDGFTNVILSVSKVAEERGSKTVQLYQIGGFTEAEKVSYAQLIAKLGGDVEAAGPGYFTEDPLSFEPIVKLSHEGDTVHYFPKDLETNNVLVCFFKRDTYAEFNMNKVYDKVMKHLQAQYPFELYLGEETDCDIEKYKKAGGKYHLKAFKDQRRYSFIDESRAASGQRYRESVKTFAVFYFKDLETGLIYAGQKNDSDSAIISTLNFCTQVKKQYGLK